MKFANIQMLFFIWAVPLLFLAFLYGMKRRKKILRRFSTAYGLKTIAPGAFVNRRRQKAALLLSALFFLSLAMSGPQYGYRWQEAERRGIDIIVALDCSRSMLASDIQPTRLDRAKREVFDLLSMLQGDRAGLVAFAGTAFLQCPLTLDYEAFNLFFNALTPDYLPVGGTDISGAINTAVNAFDPETNSEKAVILITDGENTGDEDPQKAAEAAKTAGVKLFCIGVGSPDGVPIPEEDGGFKKDRSGKIILTKLDEETLKRMAVYTGGAYVRSVAGDMDLDVIYAEEIRGKMEQSTLASSRKQIWEDRYQWPLALAVLALVMDMFLPTLKKGTAVVLLATLIWTPNAHADATDALEAYRNGEYEKALKLYIDAQLEDPDRPELYYNIGNAYYKTGKFDEAAKNFGEALKSDDPLLKEKAYYNLGNAMFKKQSYEDAIKNYEAALEIDPEDVQARQNIEFVKKVMEEIRKQEEQQRQNEEKGDKEEQKKEQEQEQEQEQKQEQGDRQGEDGEKKGQQAGKDKEQQQPQPRQAQQGEDKKEEEEQQGQAAQARPSEEQPEGMGEEQADRVLNRLEDRPGMLMYRKRHVEKDW